MRLNRYCTRPTHRSLAVRITSRTDGRPFRRKNILAEVCRDLGRLVHQTRKMAKADPHLFGPHARQYFSDTLHEAQRNTEMAAAIHKVYGPPKPGDPPLPPGVWTQRYFLNPEGRGFRKWFAETYGT